MSVIGDLATEIMYYEFDNDTSINNIPAISGWLGANLGQLNTLLYTEYEGDDAELDVESQAIYKELYLHHYYSKQARNSLRGIMGSSGGDVLSLKDENSSVTFINKNEVSKVYKGLANDSRASLDKLVGQYHISHSSPRQVGGIEASSE
jgi:hypothetical protein